MRRPRTCGIALTALIVGGAVVAVVVWALRPAQVSISMWPVRPPRAAVCVAEAHQYGYSVDAAGVICGNGSGASWYYARLTNNGPYAFMSCEASAFDSAGNVVFHGPLPFEFGGMRGLFAPGRRTITFYWFLPEKAAGRVARYTATCSARHYPWA
jgi:hypothetical protein